MKNKKIINGICYVITAALAVFYLATLVLGQKREVSKEYDLYYVDDELSRWPGEHGLDYSFGLTVQRHMQRYMIHQSLMSIKGC
mgnify:CR=1 FL=1